MPSSSPSDVYKRQVAHRELEHPSPPQPDCQRLLIQRRAARREDDRRREDRGGRVDASGVVFVDGGGATDVVAAWPGLFRAPGGCANASAGLRVAVGTGRGADGRLRLGDVSWDYSSL